jgi:hypothetical protein
VPEFDPRKLLETLVRHDVDFVLIGGMAGVARGSAYITLDMDIAYERSHANLVRLADALRELDATLRGAPSDLPFVLDARTLENGANFTFDTRFGPLDISPTRLEHRPMRFSGTAPASPWTSRASGSASPRSIT